MGNIGTKRRGRIIAGLVGALLGGGYTVLAFQLAMGKPSAPGPGVFPVLAGIFLIVASLGIAIEAFVSSAIEGDIEFPRGEGLKRVAVFGVATLAVMIALPFLGLFLSSTLYLLVLIKALGHKGWLVPALAAVLFSAIVSVVFVLLLDVPLLLLPVGLGI